MPKVVFIAHDGTTSEVEVDNGMSVMQAAINNGIDAMIAECGGACSCATCHCYIDSDWISKIELASSTEIDMLECVIAPQENSRLGCQVVMRDELDGLVVKLPESQY